MYLLFVDVDTAGMQLVRTLFKKKRCRDGFINASKHWHRLLSSLDNLRMISLQLAPDLTRLVG